MIPRMTLDIGYRALAVGLFHCTKPWAQRTRYQEVEERWCAEKKGFAHLSVRSGFDLLLQQLNWPKGSEVIVSAVTIPHMIDILHEHGLVPLPVDVEPKTMGLNTQAIKALISPRTQAIMVAHLFGGRIPLDAVAELAEQNNLLLIEDCAQAFSGSSYRGHQRAAVSMFSFGTLKTATALGGALFTVRDPDLLNKLQKARQNLPSYGNLYFAKKLARTALILAIVNRPIYPWALRLITLWGYDHDAFINGSVRGFSGPKFFHRIRKQPPPALIELLLWRLSRITGDHCEKRAKIGTLIRHHLPESMTLLGGDSLQHTHWLAPVLCDDPDHLIRFLYAHRFDATKGCSSLIPVLAPEGAAQPKEAIAAFEKLVYLPVFPPAGLRGAQRLTELLREYAAQRLGRRTPEQTTENDTKRYQMPSNGTN